MSHDDITPDDTTHEAAPHLGRFEFGIIKRKVRRMIGRAGFTPQDRGDLEQELLARLLQRLESFDPAQAHRKAFVTMVVEQSVANILRDKQAAKRDHRRVTSLNVTVAAFEDGSIELAEAVGEREHNARRCRQPRSAEELAQLISDVTEVMASLPDDLRELAEGLISQPLAAIAREWGVPRTTLGDRVRRLRRRFEDAGLQAYLENFENR
jgi:RNA polymerase sigma-70 factor (ECF subfamily)